MIYNGIDLYKFNTDKIYGHHYMPVYKMFFDNIKCDNLLEIGIDNGDSLIMFSEIFPAATIYGFDLGDKTYIDYKGKNIKTFKGDQSSLVDLENFTQFSNCEFDVILDDGGHTQYQQQVSFAYLFKHLKSGGLYIIEDLHTWGETQWNQENIIDTIEVLKTYQNSKSIISSCITEEDSKYLEATIQSVHIWSRTDDMKQSVTGIIVKK